MKTVYQTTALAALALLASVTLGFSQTVRHELTIRHAPYWNGLPNARVIHVPQPTSEAGQRAQEAEVAKWEAYCQPVRRVDEYGLARLTYRVKGCEFGKSE